MTERAVVLSVERRGVTVLCPGGAVKTVPWAGRLPSVGQEVLVGSSRAGAWSTWAAAAAMMLLVAGGASHALRPAPPASAVVGAVSVDINPSVELLMGQAGQVVDVRAYDTAGAALLRANPGMRGESVVAAVESAAAWSARHGYLTRSHAVLMLAGWAAGTRGSARVASDLRDAAAALRRQEVPGSVLALPLATGGVLRTSERDGVSLGRYLLAQMLGKAPRAVAHVPLAELFQAWPPKAVSLRTPSHQAASHASGTVPSQRSSTAPASPSRGQGVPSGGGSPKTHSGLSSKSVPAVRMQTVHGRLTGLGPDSVVVGGKAYPLAPAVDFTIGGAAAHFALGRVLQSIGASVVLTLNRAGEVVTLAVPGARHGAPVAGLP